jgi:Protein of unknown function (DUF2892)
MGQSGGCCGTADTTQANANNGGCGSGGCACGGKCACASKPFACNVGPVDRVVRIAIGLALMACVFVGPQTPFGWLGILPILSAVMGYCGLYRILGISTYKRVCCGKCKTA